jgi:sugar/nucleoside kinase (ribokinase family)
MQAQFGSRLAAATLGRGGVLAWDGQRLVHRAAYDVSVADTTGAGDIFRAGFIYGLLQGWPLERQLDFSCAAAAMNCTAQGARGGIKPVAAIEQLMDVTPRCAGEYRAKA